LCFYLIFLAGNFVEGVDNFIKEMQIPEFEKLLPFVILHRFCYKLAQSLDREGYSIIGLELLEYSNLHLIEFENLDVRHDGNGGRRGGRGELDNNIF